MSYRTCFRLPIKPLMSVFIFSVVIFHHSKMIRNMVWMHSNNKDNKLVVATLIVDYTHVT